MSDTDDPRLAADPAATAIALACARSLLRVESRSEAADVLHRAIVELGGEVRPSVAPGPVPDPDVSLGIGEACAAVAGDGSQGLAGSAALLRVWLPLLLEDAEVAASRCDRQQSQEVWARTDALTGLSDRREADQRLAAAGAGDVVCLLDLDDFKGLNDSRGHAAGDLALRRFGDILRERVRDLDFVARYGGDEFLVVLAGAPVAVAIRRMRDISAAWAGTDPEHGVSVGVALVDGRGPQTAAADADRALYRGKRAGGGRVLLAGVADRRPDPPTPPTV